MFHSGELYCGRILTHLLGADNLIPLQVVVGWWVWGLSSGLGFSVPHRFWFRFNVVGLLGFRSWTPVNPTIWKYVRFRPYEVQLIFFVFPLHLAWKKLHPTFIAEVVPAASSIAGWTCRTGSSIFVWSMTPPVTSEKKHKQENKWNSMLLWPVWIPFPPYWPILKTYGGE